MLFNATAGLAVDGNSDSDMAHGSVTHTGGGDTAPWWAVDLGAISVIQRVEITNRGDCCGTFSHFFCDASGIRLL